MSIALDIIHLSIEDSNQFLKAIFPNDYVPISTELVFVPNIELTEKAFGD